MLVDCKPNKKVHDSVCVCVCAIPTHNNGWPNAVLSVSMALEKDFLYFQGGGNDEVLFVVEPAQGVRVG